MNTSAPTVAVSMEAVLADVRKDLLDFGLRNPLLNYRLLKSRGLDVTGAAPAEVFRHLVSDGCTYMFRGAEDRAVEQGSDPEEAAGPAAGNPPPSAETADDRAVEPGSDSDEAAGPAAGDPLPSAETADDRAVEPGSDPDEAAGPAAGNPLPSAETADDRAVEPGSDPDEAAGPAAGNPPPSAETAEERPAAERPRRRRYLRTALNETLLQTRLLATYYAARTSIEEQGVNTLFLALGMLRWRADDDDADVFHCAPLVLVPVELERSNARERFHLRYTSEETGDNVCLSEYLKQALGIELPEFPEPEDLDIAEYFEGVRKAVVSQSVWSVDASAVALGFFSFAKFLMYRDLDAATWPNPSMLTGHDLLNRLLGAGQLGGEQPPYGESDFVDDLLKQRPVHQVVDADSSQTLVILDVSSGRNVVIQGPPGTGKSQTIVNLIANAIAEGRRVLFVAEKMAALEVVKRRLDATGAGAACLELHSNKTNKKALIEELRRTMLAPPPPAAPMPAGLDALEESAGALNDYCRAVNEPVRNAAESPASLYGRLLEMNQRLDGIALPALELPGSAEWTDVERDRRRRLAGELMDRLATCGVPREHPFWGSRLCVLPPTRRDAMRGKLLEAAARTRDLATVSAQSAGRLSIGPLESRDAIRQAQATCVKVLAAPPLRCVDGSAEEWTSGAAGIRKALADGARLRALHREWDVQLRPEAWDLDGMALRGDLAAGGSGILRFFSGRWRAARNRIAACLSQPAPRRTEALFGIIDAVLEAGRLKSSLGGASGKMGRLFGPFWNGEASDWDLLETQSNWIVSALEGVRRGELANWAVPAACAGFDRSAMEECADALEHVLKVEEQARGAVESMLELDLETALPSFGKRMLPEVEARWTAMAGRVADLDALVGYNQAARDCDAAEVGALVQAGDTWSEAATHLADLFDRTHATDLLDAAFQDRPALARFDGGRQDTAVKRFRELDVRMMEFHRGLVAQEHARKLPAAAAGNGQLGVLLREFEKRARLLPIRKLMERAGNAIQAVKPVFMMSPLSIANYLPPGALDFDLVIFDEASQVKPADALGAIVRGRQVAVVGDSKQLPPTSFFETMFSEETEEDEVETATADIESILGLFCSRGAHQRMLRWHYRSRHESLIAVSNHLFYGGRLIVFPSPDQERRELGLIYHRIEHAPYDRGRTRTNPAEGKIVAEAVLAHARAEANKPAAERLSLGVAAFSVAQMDAILNEVELLRHSHPECEEYFSAHPYEPFFVKNLENVQGDERDVIFISVGYGRTAEGYLSMSFGPLNRSGGERRLNVLISRARRRCEVFTTLSADDIDLERTQATGVAALKTFLAYCATGRLDVAARSGHESDSPFEDRVFQALTAKGYTVHRQVGSGGFLLDLAIVDPERPGRYALGVECDGASYHSARSTRDRDRLRQAVLEGLGWRIHRIWSTDWFRNPERELNRLVDAMASARRKKGRPGGLERPRGVEPARAAAQGSARAPETVPPYRVAELKIRRTNAELHEIPAVTLAGWLEDVVDVESPVHWLEAARRVANAAGTQKLGARILDAFERACAAGVESRQFARRGDFLSRADGAAAVVRDRSGLPAAARRVEIIAPEEIRASIERAVKDSYGIAPEEVALAASRLFGFARAGDNMRTVIEEECERMVKEGRLEVKNGMLIAPRGDGGE